eukprot:s1495_g2.t1
MLIRGYKRVAAHCLQHNFSGFRLKAKLHAIAHIGLEIREGLKTAAARLLNPVIWACELNEDHIGRVFRGAACLEPPELKSEIRNLAEELDVKVAAVPGQEAPDLGSSEPLRLVPQVQIKSSYHAAAHRNNEKSREKLRIQAVSAYRSMWDERFPQNWIDEDDQGREDKLQKEQAEREENHADRLKERERLPIFEAKNRVLTTIRRARVTLVAADTGSGKSTQVPQFILDEAIAQGCGRQVHVVCTQPRRLAAVSLASRVAWERGERSDGHGSTGHVVRWEEKPPRPWGSICFCTVGSLLPRISRLGASHVIVDEVGPWLETVVQRSKKAGSNIRNGRVGSAIAM